MYNLQIRNNRGEFIPLTDKRTGHNMSLCACWIARQRMQERGETVRVIRIEREVVTKDSRGIRHYQVSGPVVA
jgi:hypothetical protein